MAARPRPVDLKRYAFIRRHVPADAEVLELGCGAGAVLAALTARAAKGVEIDEAQAARARERGFTVERGDALEWTDGRSYDVVIVAEVLGNVDDPERLVANAARHVRPGGTLIVTLPNGSGPFDLLHHRLSPIRRLRRWNWLRARLRKPEYASDGHAQVRFLGWDEIRGLLSDAGFVVVEVGHSDFLSGGFRVPAPVARLDMLVADLLPPTLVSGWFLAAVKSAPE